MTHMTRDDYCRYDYCDYCYDYCSTWRCNTSGGSRGRPRSAPPPPIQPDNFISFWVPFLNVLLNKKKLNTKIYIFAVCQYGVFRNHSRVSLHDYGKWSSLSQPWPWQLGPALYQQKSTMTGIFWMIQNTHTSSLCLSVDSHQFTVAYPGIGWGGSKV